MSCTHIIAGAALFMRVTKLSNKYGEHGMMKKVAAQGVPKIIKSYSRRIFIKPVERKKMEIRLENILPIFGQKMIVFYRSRVMLL